MRNQKAETLDICMEKLFTYIESEYNKTKRIDTVYKLLLKSFEHIILPTHKSHHVQFIMFYCCSFKVSLFRSLCYLSFIRIFYFITVKNDKRISNILLAKN